MYQVVPRKIPPKDEDLSCINFGRSEEQTIIVFQLFQGARGGHDATTCDSSLAKCPLGFYPTLHPEEQVSYKTLKNLTSWYLVGGMTGSMVLAVIVFFIFQRFSLMTVVSDTATDFYHRRERFSGLRPEIFPARLHVIAPITDVWSVVKPEDDVDDVMQRNSYRRYNHCSEADWKRTQGHLAQLEHAATDPGCTRSNRDETPKWTGAWQLHQTDKGSTTNGNAYACPMILDVDHTQTWPDPTGDAFTKRLESLKMKIGSGSSTWAGGEINRSLLRQEYVGFLRPDTVKYYLIDKCLTQIHNDEELGGIQIDLKFCNIQDRLLAPERNVLEEVLKLKYSDAMAELTGEEQSRVAIKVHIVHESSSTNTDLNAKVQIYSKRFAARFDLPPAASAIGDVVMALLASVAVGWLGCVFTAFGVFGGDREDSANVFASKM